MEEPFLKYKFEDIKIYKPIKTKQLSNFHNDIHPYDYSIPTSSFSNKFNFSTMNKSNLKFNNNQVNTTIEKTNNSNKIITNINYNKNQIKLSSKSNSFIYHNKNNKINLNFCNIKKNSSKNPTNITKYTPEKANISTNEEGKIKLKINSGIKNKYAVRPKKYKSLNIVKKINKISNGTKSSSNKKVDLNSNNIVVINEINEINNNYFNNNININNNNRNLSESHSLIKKFININTPTEKSPQNNNNIHPNNIKFRPSFLIKPEISITIQKCTKNKNYETPIISISNPKTKSIINYNNDTSNIINNEINKTENNNNNYLNIKEEKKQKYNSSKVVEKYDNSHIQLSLIRKNINNFTPDQKIRDTTILWKKAKNFQKIILGLKNPTVTKIDDKLIFQDGLTNTLLDKNNINIISVNNENEKKEEKIISCSQFLKKNEVEKDFLRISLRAKAFKLIMEGVNKKNKNLVGEMEQIFMQNPERNFYLDDNNIFNQKLGNGKTLLYVACQEGCTDLVQFFLEKELNPNITVKYFGMEDSCLNVACRWGFYDIVKLLLECKRLNPEEIVKIYYNKNLYNKNIRKLLKKYLPKNIKKNKSCKCF